MTLRELFLELTQLMKDKNNEDIPVYAGREPIYKVVLIEQDTKTFLDAHPKIINLE